MQKEIRLPQTGFPTFFFKLFKCLSSMCRSNQSFWGTTSHGKSLSETQFPNIQNLFRRICWVTGVFSLWVPSFTHLRDGSFSGRFEQLPHQNWVSNKVKIWPDQIYDVQNYESLMVYWDLAHNHTHHSGFWKHHFFSTLDNGVRPLQVSPHT